MDSKRFQRSLFSPTKEQMIPQPSTAFVMCPVGSFMPVSPELAVWQQALYQWAYAQAQQLLQPSLMERDWLGVWN